VPTVSQESPQARNERGAVLVLVAVCLPALALLAAFAIDVSHWFDYSRNLQMRADAAALAAGQQYGGICATATPSAAGMADVGKMAQLYAGPPTASSGANQSDLYYPYSGANSPLVAFAQPNDSYKNVPNLKAGTDAHYHVFLNADHYWRPGERSTDSTASFTMGPASTFCHSTDENGVTGAMVDVRVTQDDLPLFFPLVGVHPTITAHSRVGVEGVGQENSIRPLAVRDAGLTPCITVKLVNTNNGTVVKSVDLAVNAAATTAANGPIVWDNGAGSVVDVPSANLYAQTVLHAQGADGTCNTSSNPLTYDQSSGLLLLNSYDDPPTPVNVGYVDPNADGTQGQWSKSAGSTAWNLLDDAVRAPTAPTTGSDQITSTTNTLQAQEIAFPNTLTWAPGETYALHVYGNTTGNKHVIEYEISTNDGASFGATPLALFGDNTGNSWQTGPIAIASQAQLDGLQVRLIHERTQGTANGSATVAAVYVERTPAGLTPRIVGTSAIGGGVTLLNNGLCAPDQYFSTSAGCGVKVCAVVWFNSDATSQVVKVNGTAMTQNGDPYCTTSVPGATAWASNVIAINPLSGQHQFTIDWSEHSASLGCANGQPCTGTFGVQQQAFAACDEGNDANTCTDPNISGPIILQEIGDAASVSSTVGSFHSGTHTITIKVMVQGLQNAQPGDPPTILKYSTSQNHQTGLIDCGQGNGAAGDKGAVFYGCPMVGTPECTNVPYCAPLIKSPDGSCNNGLRATTPGVAVDCVNVNNGNIAVIPSCIASRIIVGGGSGNNVCNPPNNGVVCYQNNWPTYATNGIPAGDPRAITMIITYPADFAAPNADVPIRTFATFYVTGWSLQGNSPDCGVYSAGNLNGNETIANPSAGMIWGHWISYTDPNAGGNGQPCNFQAFGNCAAVMSR
jgi:hypothetical protein